MASLAIVGLGFASMVVCDRGSTALKRSSGIFEATLSVANSVRAAPLIQPTTSQWHACTQYIYTVTVLATMNILVLESPPATWLIWASFKPLAFGQQWLDPLICVCSPL